MDKSDADLLNQALFPPIDDLSLVETHIRLVSSYHEWDEIGIFVDEGIKDTLILMLTKGQVVSILRVCLSVDESVTAIEQLSRDGRQVIFGIFQGENFTREQIGSIQQINELWNLIDDQKCTFDLQEVASLFRRIEEESKNSGRGKDFSTETKRQVMQVSHGRCMFTGCGENLQLEELTGTEGNFSYKAHNVASSEDGPRGVPLLSERLSDDPSNILLLCDKHHRLIDKVAAADYPAYCLSEMRKTFIATTDKLLEALSYTPIPVFAVSWPVHRQVISAPTKHQISQSLAPIRCRMDSLLNDISDNEAILRETVSLSNLYDVNSRVFNHTF